MPPVEDHPVHESTQIKADKPYGCWLEVRVTRADGYIAHPWNKRGGKFILFRMSRDCRYDLAGLDQRCRGCIRAQPQGGVQ